MNNESDGTEIRIDKDKNRLYVKVVGFVKKERSEKNFREIMMKAKELEENAGALMDLRDFTIAQNYESINSDLSHIIPKVKYIANLMGSSPVGKLQIHRFTEDSNKNQNIKFFDDLDEAIKWLDSKQG